MLLRSSGLGFSDPKLVIQAVSCSVMSGWRTHGKTAVPMRRDRRNVIDFVGVDKMRKGERAGSKPE